MTNLVKFSCSVATSDPSAPLGVNIRIDGKQIFNSEHIFLSEKVEYEFEDTEGYHLLEIELKNKLQEHTKIDENGAIISDARIIIKDIKFDEIEVDEVFQQRAIYAHNFNGTGSRINDKFFGELGCNGIVGLAFTGPVYLWLLENI